MDSNQNSGMVKRLSFVVFFLMVLVSSTLCTMADTVIKTITVSSTMPAAEGGTVRLPEFKAPKGCDLEIEWTSSESSFAPGKKVNATIILTAEEGYQFARNTTITVRNGEVTGKSISDSEIILKVKVGPLYYKLSAPEEVAWSSEKSSVVKWSAVKYATNYEVKVYHDDKVVKRETVKSKSYDAGKYFNGENEVTVSVTALGTDSSDSKYLSRSDEAFVDGADVDWGDRESTYGSWEGKRYLLTEKGEDKEYAKGWIEIFGKWYYFDRSNSFMDSLLIHVNFNIQLLLLSVLHTFLHIAPPHIYYQFETAA